MTYARGLIEKPIHEILAKSERVEKRTMTTPLDEADIAAFNQRYLDTQFRLDDENERFALLKAEHTDEVKSYKEKLAAYKKIIKKGEEERTIDCHVVFDFVNKLVEYYEVNEERGIAQRVAVRSMKAEERQTMMNIHKLPEAM